MDTSSNIVNNHEAEMSLRSKRATSGGNSFEDIQHIVTYIRSITSYVPRVAIICGTGLGQLANDVRDQVVIPYEDIDGFPVSTVPGHVGQLVFGKLNEETVVLMQGRCHLYEGYTASKLAIPIRTFKELGTHTLIVTNAAGGLNDRFKVGDVMLVKDHINVAGLAGVNPLLGEDDGRFGPRFPAMSDAYDRDLLKLAPQIYKESGLADILQEGVYGFVTGPSFETVAESRFLRIIGADAVGMSTVPEVIAARHCDLRVIALSLITNMSVIDYDVTARATVEEVIRTAESRAKDLQTLVRALVKHLKNI